MRHLDEKKLLAYLGRKREFADPATHREATLHIVKCSKCSKRIEEVRKKKRVTLARQRQVQPIELISPDDHTSAPDSAHLSERQLESYLNSRDEFADPAIRGAYGDHVSRCNQCSERLVDARGKLRASGQLRLYEPELLTPAGLKPAGRLSPAPIRPIDDPLGQAVSRQSGSSARASGEASGNGSGSGASVVESQVEDGKADLAAAKREVEAALREAEVAREKAEVAKRDAEVMKREAEAAKEAEARAANERAEGARLELERARKEGEAAKREAEAVRRRSAAALARYEAEATKTQEAESALKEAEAARREAEAARKEADAAKRETAGVRAAAKKVARATKERREAEAVRRAEVEAARREAEQAREEAETAREEARRASAAVTTGQIDATEIRLAEAARKEAEAARREAEAARKEAAAAKQKTAEIKTVALKVAKASKKRRAAESAHRAEAEAAKHEAEEARQEAEAARREAEAAKREADELRQVADQGEAGRGPEGADREVAEAARMAAEAARTLAEAARKEAEVARKEVEVARQEAELAKRQAEAIRQRDVDVDVAVESALSAAASRSQSPPESVSRPDSENVAARRSRRWVALVALIPIAAGAVWLAQSTLSGPGASEPVALASPSAQPTPGAPEPAPAFPSGSAAGDSAGVAGQIAAAARGPVGPPADELIPAAREDPPVQVAVPAPVPQPRPVQPRAAQPQPEPARPTPRPPPPPRAIAGIVLDTESNTPLPGARVVISGTGAATTSGSGGSFRFADVPAGDVEIVASLAGYSDARVRTVVAPGSEARIDLRLQPTEAPAPPAAAVDSAVEEPAVSAPAPAPTGPTVLPTREETDPELVSGAWVRIDRGEAEELLGRGLVAVADLPIESVAKPGSANRRGVRIVQLLDSGERLEIVITRPPFLSRSRGRGGAARVSAVRVAEAAPGTPTVTGTARLGGYLVTAKADLASGVLSDLLNRITDVPR